MRQVAIAVMMVTLSGAAQAQVNYSTDHLIRVETPAEKAAADKFWADREAAAAAHTKAVAKTHAYVEKMEAEDAAAAIPRAPAMDDDPNSFLRELEEIDATHEPPCGICDPITPSTPTGTYTVPWVNRR